MRLPLIRVGGLIILLLVMVLLAGCEDDPAEEPPTISAAQRVTLTLQPPLPLVTQTGVFTATLPPSNTPLPSDTLLPSETPTPITPTNTPTATPSPTLGGIVSQAGAATKLVREGPSTNAFDVAARLDRGVEIGVLGYVVNDIQEIWYQISFIDPESEEVLTGWMRSDLVDVEDEDAIPEISTDPIEVAEDSTPTATETSSTPIPFESAVPSTPYTAIPTDEELDVTTLSDVGVRAAPNAPENCEITPEFTTITTEDTISIFWSWFVTEEERMQEHIDNVDYEIVLDGFVLEDWSRFRTPMFQDPLENNNYSVYWYVPIGQLEEGEHTLAYRATWDTVISDGAEQFGPGTENEEEFGSCTFIVVAAD